MTELKERKGERAQRGRISQLRGRKGVSSERASERRSSEGERASSEKV